MISFHRTLHQVSQLAVVITNGQLTAVVYTYTVIKEHESHANLQLGKESLKVHDDALPYSIQLP